MAEAALTRLLRLRVQSRGMLIIPFIDRCSDRCLDDLHAACPDCGENVTGAGDLSFLIHLRSYWDALFGSFEEGNAKQQLC
jgi:hypothetical protein